jgi:Carboxypeptidase regulatory-like domain
MVGTRPKTALAVMLPPLIIGVLLVLSAYTEQPVPGTPRPVQDTESHTLSSGGSSCSEGEPDRSRCPAPGAYAEARGALIVTLIDGARAERPMAHTRLELSSSRGLGVGLDDGRTTDGEGLATWEDLPPDEYWIALPGVAHRRVTVVAGCTERLEFRVGPWVTLEGEVLDAFGVPVPGAEVWLSAYDSQSRGHVACRTDADGHFSTEIALRTTRWVASFAQGHGPSAMLALQPTDTFVPPVTLVLGEAGQGLALAGYVQDPSGERLAGIPVSVLQQSSVLHSPDGTVQRSTPPPRQTRTDANGEFQFVGLFRGAVRLVAAAPGFSSADLTLYPRDVDAGRVRLELVPAPALAGVVVDRLGSPVGAVSVGYGRYGDPAGEVVKTDDEGRFLLQRPPARPFALMVAKAGFRGRELNVPTPSGAGTQHMEITLEPSGSATLVVTLSPPTDDLGRAWSLVATDLGQRTALRAGARMAAEGEGVFRQEAWPAGRTRLAVYSADLRTIPFQVRVISVPEGEATVEVALVLPPDAAGHTRIAGRVSGDLNSPVRDIMVSARRIGSPASLVLEFDGADGAFSGLVSNWGQWVLELSDRAGKVLYERAFQPAGLKELDLGTLELGGEAELHLAGVDESGSGIPLRVMTAGGRTVREVLLGSWGYVLSLPSGDYVLVSSSTLLGVRRWPIQLAGGDQVRIDVGPLPVATYPVRVILPAGLAGQARLRMLEVGARLPLLDEPLPVTNGCDQVFWVAPGEYELSAELEGYAPVQRTLTCGPGAAEGETVVQLPADAFR